MESRRPFQKINPIFFDHNATSPVHPNVVEALPRLAESWGNASSIHWGGREPKNIIRDARKKLSQILKCSPLELVFTSGGSESNNQILKGLFEKNATPRNQIIVSPVEHPSVMKTANFLQQLGAEILYLKIGRDGQLDFAHFQSMLSEKTLLVSCMFVNNETGIIFPIQEMAKASHSVGAYFHADCVQAFGKISLDLGLLNVDFASFSAHKIYSLKGTGFHFVRKGIQIESLIHGGGQERHRRGGTENIFGIGALSIVCDQFYEILEAQNRIEKLRDEFEAKVLQLIPGVVITQKANARVKNTSHLLIDGIDGETLLMSLDLKGYAVSTGAACSSGNPEPSPALLAMGFTRDEAQQSLRVSFGMSNTEVQITEFVLVLKEVVDRLRHISSGGSTLQASRVESDIFNANEVEQL